MQNLYEKIKENENILKNEVNIMENNIDTITLIGIELLDEFNSHIFSKLSENKYTELKESIRRNGVLSPIIVRKKKDRYEIISGHNRVNCCKELGIKEVPCVVKEYDDDKAELIMIETNLTQREDILLCEKGLAYKKQLELIKKINKENGNKYSDSNDLQNCNHNEYIRSIDEVSNNSEDSKTSIQRLIRLTELIKSLQQKVNYKEISLLVGVELSYLASEEQELIYKYITQNNIQLTVSQSQKIREYKGELTEDLVDDIITGKKNKAKTIKFTGKVQKDVYKKYKDKFNNDKEFSNLVDILLEEYFNNENKDV